MTEIKADGDGWTQVADDPIQESLDGTDVTRSEHVTDDECRARRR